MAFFEVIETKADGREVIVARGEATDAEAAEDAASVEIVRTEAVPENTAVEVYE